MDIMKKIFCLGVDNNDHLSYRLEEENAIANTHSNEPGDDTFGPQSLPLEEEQVCSVVLHLEVILKFLKKIIKILEKKKYTSRER